MLMDLSENPNRVSEIIPNQIMLKPNELCGMCQDLGEKCHCLCHKKPIAHGYHEIIYERNNESTAG